MTDPSPTPGVPRKRARAAVFVTVLLDLLGFGMILPILPFYGLDYGATDFQVGLLFASYSAAQLVFSPLLGRLSDRLGRRPLLLASIATNVVAHAAFAYAATFWVLVAARTLSGVAASNIGIAQAYMADVTSRRERSRAMGMIGAAFGLGFILGPAFGGLLSQVSLRAVPLGAAALALVNLGMAAVWLPESLSAARREERRGQRWLDPGQLAAVARDRPLFTLLLLFFSVTLCFAVMEATFALFAEERFLWTETEVSWTFVYIGVLVVLIQGVLIGPLVRRFGERHLIPAGVAVMAAGLLLMASARQPATLLAAAGLLAVGTGLNSPSTLGLLSKLTDEGSQGSVLGLSRSFGSLARVVGPLAGTWAFQEVAPAVPFLGAGVLMALMIAAALWVTRRARHTDHADR